MKEKRKSESYKIMSRDLERERGKETEKRGERESPICLESGKGHGKKT